MIRKLRIVLIVCCFSAFHSASATWQTPIARFDMNLYSGGAGTAIGFTAIKPAAETATLQWMQATDANGITLKVRAIENLDRSETTPTTSSSMSLLSRDMMVHTSTSTDTNNCMQVIVEGLAANTEYLVRVYSARNNWSYDEHIGLWCERGAASLVTTDSKFLLTHSNFVNKYGAQWFDEYLTTDADGILGLLARATGAGSAYFNGIEIFPAPPKKRDVMKVDINNNSDGDGPEDATAAGYVGLVFPAGETVGTVTYRGISVTVTNQEGVGFSRHRNNMAGEDVLEDFVFATGNEEIYVDIDGLTSNYVYEFTIYSADTQYSADKYSQWFINARDPKRITSDPFRGDHYNKGSPSLNRASYKFTTRYVTRESSVRITGSPRNSGHSVFLNGLEIRDVGIERVLAVDIGKTGQRVLGYDFQEISIVEGSGGSWTGSLSSKAGKSGTISASLTGTDVRDRGDYTAHAFIPMLEDFVFGGTVTMTLSNMRNGSYEILVYGVDVSYDTANKLSVDGVEKGSTMNARNTNPQDASQLAGRFTVSDGDATITVEAAGDSPRVSGFELFWERPPAGTVILLW